MPEDQRDETLSSDLPRIEIIANPETGETSIDHPTDLLLALKMIMAAQQAIVAAMAANRQAAIDAASGPRVKVAGEGALRHIGNGHAR